MPLLLLLVGVRVAPKGALCGVAPKGALCGVPPKGALCCVSDMRCSSLDQGVIHQRIRE